MASSLNRVILMGRIQSEPAMRQVAPMENAVCFQILVSTPVPTARGEEYQENLVADVEIPVQLAQPIQNSLHQGTDVFLSGRLRLISWQDPMSGRRRNTLVIRAEQIQAALADDGAAPDYANAMPPQEYPPVPEQIPQDPMMDSPF